MTTSQVREIGLTFTSQPSMALSRAEGSIEKPPHRTLPENVCCPPRCTAPKPRYDLSRLKKMINGSSFSDHHYTLAAIEDGFLPCGVLDIEAVSPSLGGPGRMAFGPNLGFGSRDVIAHQSEVENGHENHYHWASFLSQARTGPMMCGRGRRDEAATSSHMSQYHC